MLKYIINIDGFASPFLSEKNWNIYLHFQAWPGIEPRACMSQSAALAEWATEAAGRKAAAQLWYCMLENGWKGNLFWILFLNSTIGTFSKPNVAHQTQM